jgi:hypothetical protein
MRIICITGEFSVYDRNGIDTERKEFVVSHGINEKTGEMVILPCEPPLNLGAKFDNEIYEWVIDNCKSSNT